MSDEHEIETKAPAPDATPEAAVDPFAAQLVAALKSVYDPEIPVDVYELGLIYRLDVEDNTHTGDKDVIVDMTLTAPACPVAGEMPEMVRSALLGVPGVGEVTVNMVFEPPWTPERMSDEAKLELNMY